MSSDESTFVDTHMVWVDVETTGLFPAVNKLLEIGLIVTDILGNPVDQRDWLVSYSDVNKLRYDSESFIRDMHDKSGLWSALRSQLVVPLHEVDDWLYDWLYSLADGNIVGPMCGSSVAFDRGFINQCLPSSAAMFSYRNIDVSTLKELAQRLNPAIRFPEIDKTEAPHRSIPDLLQGTLPEYRHYVDNFLFVTE